MRYACMVAATFGLLLTARGAFATPTLLVNGSGVVTGATGVSVNGTLYDVTLVDTTCALLFSGCDSPSDFDFPGTNSSENASALLASTALAEAFVGASYTGVLGCDFPFGYCDVAIPYFVSGNVWAEDARVELGGLAYSGQTIFANNQLNLATFGSDVFADFTPAAAPVPEPASLLLLGTGLAGAVGAARRRRKQSAR